jgi:hypothetical protein
MYAVNNYKHHNLQNGEDTCISQVQQEHPNDFLVKDHNRYCGLFRGLYV